MGLTIGDGGGRCQKKIKNIFERGAKEPVSLGKMREKFFRAFAW
jgi:hypothetical protein